MEGQGGIVRFILKLALAAILLPLAALGGYVLWQVSEGARSARRAAGRIERAGKTAESASKRLERARKEWRRIRNAGRAFQKEWEKR
jgi:hypothetical protein